MLSIVIPTLNEEKCLPLLLESLKKQNFDRGESSVYEIIVADAGSEDKTVEMAKDYGCRIVKGGMPSKGKNEGAKAAKRDLILFVDADIVLPENFLEKAFSEFKKRNLDVASFYLGSQNKNHNILFDFLYNFPSRITEKILPQAMNIILVRQKAHQQIGGFDEEIKLGEELDYIRKIARIGRFGVLKSVKALASSRRYQQDGWIKTWSKYFLCQLHMIFLGPVKSDIFKYRFDHYSRSSKNRDDKQ